MTEEKIGPVEPAWRVSSAGWASNGAGPEKMDPVYELRKVKTGKRVARFYGEDGRRIARSVCAILNAPSLKVRR